jgi:hypothetical protein
MSKTRQTVMICLLGCALGATATVAGAQAIRLEPRIQLSDQQRARLQAIANQGPDALRQFLWRTRMIYGWTWRDLVVVD